MLEIKNLSKTYNKGTDMEKQILNDLSLKIEEKTTLAIIGTNGCGKSTLMNLIAGNILADAGSISLDGKDLSNIKERKRLSFLTFYKKNKGKVNSLILSLLTVICLFNFGFFKTLGIWVVMLIGYFIGAYFDKDVKALQIIRKILN